MEATRTKTNSVAEAQEISKQIQVELALLFNIEEAFRIALNWKTKRNGGIRQLSTLRFVARSFERHLMRVRMLSEYGGYMHLATDMKPQLGNEVRTLKLLRDDLQSHLEQLLLRMEHISPSDPAAFGELCAKLEDYLKDLGLHAQRDGLLPRS